MTGNRQVEAALRGVASTGGPGHPASKDPAREGAPNLV
jgi:hypothetical protein